jgi:4'-phosphopantetheinyl transferase
MRYISSKVDNERLYLWFGYPDDVVDETARDACARILSEEERVCWQAFRFEKHRREYLTSHALARFALSHYHSPAPEA